jgi:demethylmenaquinone methyltransferase / 2-methoxy-6-polyprenyl-1,4-benzoquinol methylase
LGGCRISKALEINRMFDSIAPSYDILNHILSLGLDFGWRNKLAAMAERDKSLCVLDLATGTGDLLIALLRKNPNIAEAVGLDISANMLDLCRKKAEKAGLAKRIRLVLADEASNQFAENSFDLVTMGFGIRNFSDTLNSLMRIKRLLKNGGTTLILEFTNPANLVIRRCYRFYLENFVPLAGGLISRRRDAYSYLSTSIQGFYKIRDFCNLMQKAGFDKITATPLTCGVVCIYKGEKE